jgi:hypothetical protein
MIVGLASSLPHAMASGLEAHGVPAATARHVGALPPVSILFAAFLGYNPVQQLLGPHVLASLSAGNRGILTGRSFFPHLISAPFRSGLHEAFAFAIIACLIAAAASLMRGGKYHYAAPTAPGAPALEPEMAADDQVRARALTNAAIREEQHAS